MQAMTVTLSNGDTMPLCPAGVTAWATPDTDTDIHAVAWREWTPADGTRCGDCNGEISPEYTAVVNVTVTLPAGVWSHVLEALDAYQNDDDARADYADTAGALDYADMVIRAYLGGGY